MTLSIAGRAVACSAIGDGNGGTIGTTAVGRIGKDSGRPVAARDFSAQRRHRRQPGSRRDGDCA